VYLCASLLITTILYCIRSPRVRKADIWGYSALSELSWGDLRTLHVPSNNAITDTSGKPSESDSLRHVNELYRFPDLKADKINDVHNDSLGFQEVWVLSMKERTDKHDAFAVQAALTGLKYNIAEGVDGTTIPSKALPYTMAIDKASLGCWRAHLNILQDMVDRRVASALIFEDDADWDVALKVQLVQFARGSRFLLNTPENTTTHSPYGDGWDILWLGHCSSRNDQSFGDNPLDNRRFVIPNDPTVVPPGKRTEFDQPDMSLWEGPGRDNSTRIVHVPTWGNCAAAYAISLQGAEKALYHLSMMPYNEPVDMGFGFMCMFKKSNFSCIAPFPTLVGVSKPAGDTSKWSDLDHINDDQRGQIHENGYSERVVFSTRQNIDRLLQGETTFKSQYPEATGPEMSIEEIGRAVGHPEWIELPDVSKVDEVPGEIDFTTVEADTSQSVDEVNLDPTLPTADAGETFPVVSTTTVEADVSQSIDETNLDPTLATIDAGETGSFPVVSTTSEEVNPSEIFNEDSSLMESDENRNTDIT
jgi:GR25 family glycosyltransferase involved in LPS biosynthesis